MTSISPEGPYLPHGLKHTPDHQHAQNIGDFLLTHFLAVADWEDEPIG